MIVVIWLTHSSCTLHRKTIRCAQARRRDRRTCQGLVDPDGEKNGAIDATTGAADRGCSLHLAVPVAIRDKRRRCRMTDAAAQKDRKCGCRWWTAACAKNTEEAVPADRPTRSGVGTWRLVNQLLQTNRNRRPLTARSAYAATGNGGKAATRIGGNGR